MKALGYFVLFASVGVGLGAFVACSSSNDTAAGAGGSSSSSSSSSASSTSSSTSSSSSSSGSTPPVLAGACTKDADCGGDLACSLPSVDDPVFSGGPAGGYCTKPCTTQTDCPTPGICHLGASGGGLMECLLPCTIGPDLTQIDEKLDPSKCRGRSDLRCVQLSQTDAVCLPTCGMDAQCVAPRVCDPRLSVCVEPAKVNKGDKTGASCDPTAMPPTCSGICISATSADLRMCTEPCGLGQPLTDPPQDCGGLDQGLCAFRPTGFGAGDQGFCTNACKSQDDCQNPDWWCFGATFQKGNGYCLPAVDCPNGDVDCVDSSSNPLKEKCHATKYGPKCIDTTWPLGTAAPIDGGAGGAAPSDAGMGGGG